MTDREREALIEELWPLVKTNGYGARERTRHVLEELDRRGLLRSPEPPTPLGIPSWVRYRNLL